jgi:hypothetical protein
MLKERFLQARQGEHKIRITFHPKADRPVLMRICAPLDYGPGKVDRSDHLHVWEYSEDGSGGHLLSLKPEQVVRIDLLDEEFDPADFMWFINRDWGQKL